MKNHQKTLGARYTMDQFLQTEMIHSQSISSDEQSIIYSSDRSGVYNAYTIAIDGGDPTPLTESTEEAVHVLSYFPNDRRFLYTSDQGGNELHHIYLQDEQGDVTDLTPFDQAKAIYYGWSQDDRGFYFGVNQRDPRFMDVYYMDIDSLEPTLLFKNDGYEFAAISKDRRYVALTTAHNMNSNTMYLYDAVKEELKPLLPHDDDILYHPQCFGDDSKELYFLTDDDREHLYLKKINLESGAQESVIEERWDLSYAYFSKQSQYLVYGMNVDAQRRPKIIHWQTKKELSVPLPEGFITECKMSASEKKVTFMLQSAVSSNNLYVYDLETEELKQLTNTFNSEMDQQELATDKIVRYASFDGLEIPAVYYKPHVREGEKVPALVWVHGGPGGQSMRIYSPVIQYLVNQGYAVLAVNNRGSSGYGKTFFQAADLKHGEVDLEDCIRAKEFLADTGYVDEKRIGIIGGSYGGYMVLAALAFRPDEFEVGVDIFGVANWDRTLKSIPSWWETMRDSLYQKIGNPYTQEDYIHSISPLFHAEKIEKPLIVLQGANDPRVLQVESDEIVEKVKQNAVPVEYIVFPDEGHGFTKKKNQKQGYEGILRFLDQHL
ncbi:S9 family peptidase [Bacillus fonticola]|uniref:S9 family peptidase n=1 Tax=Bacillus fonticola TaxID=2728853 RepID=UPI001D158F4C|nr:alpha/beta fold hydrolase [Bacillus fonticola]